MTDDEPGGRGAQIGSIPLVVHYLQFRFLTSVKEEEVINRAIIILKGINRRCPFVRGMIERAANGKMAMVAVARNMATGRPPQQQPTRRRRQSSPVPRLLTHWIGVTAGTFQDLFRIDGSCSFGEYIRSISINLSVGAGSQFVSQSTPGD